MKEVMNNENMEIVEEVMETTVTPEVSGNGILGKIVVGAVVLAGGAALLWKNRDKIEQRRIKKLEKKGYVVYPADEVEVIEKDCEEENIEETE